MEIEKRCWLPWVPVKEHQPKISEEVLCCATDGTQMIGTIIQYPCFTGYAAESACTWMSNVVAWMPLPKPYKGVE